MVNGLRHREQPPKRPKEHRVVMNARTLDGIMAKHPELFGPFGAKVTHSGPAREERE